MYGSLLLSLFGIFVYNRQHENGRLEILAFEALFLWTQKNIKATIFLRFFGKLWGCFQILTLNKFGIPFNQTFLMLGTWYFSFDLKLENLKRFQTLKKIWQIDWFRGYCVIRKDFKRKPRHLYVLIYISFCHRIHIWILFLLMFLASSFYQKNPANPQHMTSRTSYDHLRPTSTNLASSHI